MGRRAKDGWVIRWKRGIAYVRFTHKRRRYDESTGERDPERANEAAKQIFSAVVAGTWRKVAGMSAARAFEPLETHLAEWLTSLDGVLDHETVKTYTTYAWTHFEPFFKDLSNVNATAMMDYARGRMSKVLRTTVLKELSALRGFAGWAHERGLLPSRLPLERLNSKWTGTRSGPQRSKPVDIDASFVERFLAVLPEKSRRGGRGGAKPFIIRDRFLFAWETGLRPGTIEKLSVPEHFHKGSKELVIPDEDDKARYGRSVTLSDRAREALERVAPEKGLIFGKHDFRAYLKPAAQAAGGLPEHLAKKFASYDLRHGRATDLLGAGAPLLGVSYQLGHKQATTTNRYLKSRQKAGEDALRAAGGLRESNPIAGFSGTGETGASGETPKTPVRGKGLEPLRLATLEPESSGNQEGSHSYETISGTGGHGEAPVGSDTGTGSQMAEPSRAELFLCGVAAQDAAFDRFLAAEAGLDLEVRR